MLFFWLTELVNATTNNVAATGIIIPLPPPLITKIDDEISAGLSLDL